MSQEIVLEDDVNVEDEGIEEGGEGEQPKDPYAGLTEEQLKERLSKAEKAIVNNKRNPKPTTVTTQAPEQGEIPDWGKQLLETNAKRDFGYAQNLPPEAVDAAFKYNGGQAPTAEMLETDEALKAIVGRFRSKSRVASNTPQGGAIPTYKGRTYSETVTDKTATQADKQAAFEQAKKKHGVS